MGEGEAAPSPRTAHLSLSQSNLKTFSGKREFKALVNKQLFMQRVSGQVAEKKADGNAPAPSKSRIPRCLLLPSGSARIHSLCKSSRNPSREG